MIPWYTDPETLPLCQTDFKNIQYIIFIKKNDAKRKKDNLFIWTFSFSVCSLINVIISLSLFPEYKYFNRGDFN